MLAREREVNVSRARCQLQAGKKKRKIIAVTAVRKNAISPKNKPSNSSLGFLSMGRGALLMAAHSLAGMKSEAPPRKLVITCSLSLFYSGVLNAFSILCCFSDFCALSTRLLLTSYMFALCSGFSANLIS